MTVGIVIGAGAASALWAWWWLRHLARFHQPTNQ